MRQTYRNKKRKFYFTPTPKVTGVIFGFALITYSSVFGVKHLVHKTHLFMLEDIKISGLQYLNEDEMRKCSQVEMDQPFYNIRIDQISKNFLASVSGTPAFLETFLIISVLFILLVII